MIYVLKLRDHLNNVWRPRSVYRRLDDIQRRLDDMHRTLAHLHELIHKQGHRIMATLDEDIELIRQQGTKLDGLKVLLDGLKQQVADALSGVNLPPAVQAKVDQIFSDATGNSAKIDAALAENTPAEPPADPNAPPPANP